MPQLTQRARIGLGSGAVGLLAVAMLQRIFENVISRWIADNLGIEVAMMFSAIFPIAVPIIIAVALLFLAFWRGAKMGDPIITMIGLLGVVIFGVIAVVNFAMSGGLHTAAANAAMPVYVTNQRVIQKLHKYDESAVILEYTFQCVRSFTTLRIFVDGTDNRRVPIATVSNCAAKQEQRIPLLSASAGRAGLRWGPHKPDPSTREDYFNGIEFNRSVYRIVVLDESDDGQSDYFFMVYWSANKFDMIFVPDGELRSIGTFMTSGV